MTVDSPQGVKTLWGKELGSVVAASEAEKGDAIRITHEGKHPVQVKTRDGRTIETHRNKWAVELPERGIATGSHEEPAPNLHEQRSMEWKREQVLAHAAEYRSLSATFADGFTALSRGFAAAADLLERGLSLTPEIIERARRNTMPEARHLNEGDISERNMTIEDGARTNFGMPHQDELTADTAKALTVIEEARDKLAEVRDTIPQLAPADRPEVEAQYFAAVRDVERLSTGLDRAEYSDPAQGTIYADGHREAIAAMDRSQLSEVLEGTGIDAAEVAARANIEARSAALEAHWVAVDAQNLAAARGYDMATEEGSRQAYEDLAATYRAISERSVLTERAVPDLPDDRDLVSSVEDRQALIAEARELAGRDHLSPEQQERLTEIVEQVAGKDAVHELRAGNSDTLSEIVPDKAERLDMAEKYLEAEQSRGVDRSDAITAVKADRDLMEINRKAEHQETIERETAREAEVRRERGRDDGHEL